MDIDPNPSQPEPDRCDLSWQRALRATLDIINVDVVVSLEIKPIANSEIQPIKIRSFLVITTLI